jgi:hypothetical protein
LRPLKDLPEAGFTGDRVAPAGRGKNKGEVAVFMAARKSSATCRLKLGLL